MKNMYPGFIPPWQDAPTLAAHLSISVETIDNWVKDGRLPEGKIIGGEKFWRKEEVEVCRRGHVYFIESGGFIKIGFTENLKSRLSVLASGSSHPIETLLVIWGPRSLEAKFHKKFNAIRDHGEWFCKSPELLSFIEDLRLWG